MPRTCSVCGHPDRPAIDAALVGGESLRNIAQQFGTSATALHRHRAEHLPAALVAAQDAVEASQADSLLAQLRGLLGRADDQYAVARGIVGKAVAADDLRAATAALQAGNGALREARGCVELLAELEGEISRRPEVSITISTEWIEIRSVILMALQTHPAARQAVVRALGKVDDNAVA